jgi:hypothetical protein
MRSLPVLERHPSLRWLVPAAVAAAVGAFLVDVAQDHSRSTALPAVGAEQLVAQARAASRPYAGTALVQLSGDSSELADLLDGDAPSLSLARLPAGAHTLRVWYGNRTHRRVALVDPMAESDLFRAGSQTWEWNSADRVAIRGRAAEPSASALWTSPVTPEDLADALLASASRDAEVTVAGAETVANRPAYGLVLRPTAPDSLVDYVHVAVDGATKTPLAVQIYPRDDDDPAVDVAFTSIAFRTPPASVFQFRPPEGATVLAAGAPASAVEYGAGWSAVVCYERAVQHVPVSTIAASDHAVVEGTWGHGRLVELPLLSALLTQDGHAFVGPVTPSALYAAAVVHRGAS